MHDPNRLWFTRSDWDSAKSAFTAPGKGSLASELPSEPATTEYVCGAALFFRADVARQIGLFDERFFLVYEDSDWCFRARRAGFACLTVPSARVWHKVGTSFGSEASPLRTYFSTRNKLLLGRKEYVAPRVVAYSACSIAPSVSWSSASTGRHRARCTKSCCWSIGEFAREWKRKIHDPQEVAHRRAVLDYVFRRFGDCPPQIRVLTKAWASAEREQVCKSSGLRELMDG